MNKFEHGGNVYKAAEILDCKPKDIIDLSSNVIPFEWIKNHIKFDFSNLNFLPEPYSISLIKKIATKFSLNPKHIIVCCGTTELIKEICNLFFKKKAVIFYPTYMDYERYCIANNIKITHIPYSVLDFKHGLDLAFICNPNNPTGSLHDKNQLECFIKKHPNTLFVIDESYMNFVESENKFTFLKTTLKNVVVLRSFSKIYGVPGIRAGWGYCTNETILNRIKNKISEWSLNVIAQQICFDLLDMNLHFIKTKIRQNREWFVKKLSCINNMDPLPSVTNYVLLKLKNISSKKLYHYCLKEKILIRDCSNFYGLDHRYVRVSIKEKQYMKSFLEVVKSIS